MIDTNQMTKEKLIELVLKQDSRKFRTENFNTDRTIRLIESLEPDIPIPQWSFRIVGNSDVIGHGGPPDEIVQELTWRNDQCIIQITIPGYKDCECSVKFDYHGGISQYSFQDEDDLIGYTSRLLRAKFEVS